MWLIWSVAVFVWFFLFKSGLLGNVPEFNGPARLIFVVPIFGPFLFGYIAVNLLDGYLKNTRKSRDIFDSILKSAEQKHQQAKAVYSELPSDSGETQEHIEYSEDDYYEEILAETYRKDELTSLETEILKVNSLRHDVGGAMLDYLYRHAMPQNHVPGVFSYLEAQNEDLAYKYESLISRYLSEQPDTDVD